jgi:hypothetical protein
MDPLSALVGAVVAGAAAALQKTASTAVTDAYAALKKLLQNTFGVHTDVVEKQPSSESRKQVLREELQQSSAHQDPTVTALANALIAAIRRDCPNAASAAGVVLEDISGQSLSISRVEASGEGVSVKRAQIEGVIAITDVRAGDLSRDPK